MIFDAMEIFNGDICGGRSWVFVLARARAILESNYDGDHGDRKHRGCNQGR